MFKFILKFFKKRTKKYMKQRKIDKAFLNICVELSKLSKCVSHQVACLIVKDGRVISSGINGTASGFKNCNEVFNKKKFVRKKHHEFSSMYEIHAEMNAIMSAAKNGIAIDNSVAYCTLEPCFDCSKNLSMSGVKKIIYLKSYDLNLKADVKKRNDYLNAVNVILEKY